MNPDINTLSVEALKALAYDQLAVLNNAQRNLEILNAKIAEKSKAEPEVLPAEDMPA